MNLGNKEKDGKQPFWKENKPSMIEEILSVNVEHSRIESVSWSPPVP